MERIQHCLAVALASMLAAAACAPGPLASASDEVAPRAARIADALAEAETAHANKENARLSHLVRELRASGASPRGDAQTDMVSRWAATTELEIPPYRGRLLGPAYVRGVLAPGEGWRSAQTFKSGVPSTLAVSHKGGGPVRMKVSGPDERLVCAPGRANRSACRFTPLYTQRYEIELVNEGPEQAVYYLVFD